MSVLSTPLAAYVGVFSVAAVACFGSLPFTRRVEDPDTRRGLFWLLALSGAWALVNVGFLLAPTEPLQLFLYISGLVVGLAAIGPWLYFCSAYTSRSLHRDRLYRRIAIVVFLVIVLLKVTNPVHQLYFTSTPTSTPFVHLAIQHGTVHWVVLGLAYVLAAIGYFVLFELFRKVGYNTTPLLALVGITGVPVLLTLGGAASPLLMQLSYEPLGVAVFAVGVLFVFLGRFQAVQLTGSHDDPAIFLSEGDRIREYNEGARELFPRLLESVGKPLHEVVPEIALERGVTNVAAEDDVTVGDDGAVDRNEDNKAIGQDDLIVALTRDSERRYYRVDVNPFRYGQTRIGQLLLFTDVTTQQRHRNELERQNERLEQFASFVSHDLRNPLNVAQGRVALEREQHDSEHLERAQAALDRMEQLISTLLTLARQGEDLGDTEVVSLTAVAERAWASIDADTAELVTESGLGFRADADRLQQLLENLFRNAVEHGGDGVAVRVGGLEDGSGFYLEDDGVGIPEQLREGLFDPGHESTSGGTGLGLLIVGEIVAAHSWSISVTEGTTGGARFEITGVASASHE